MGSFAIIRPAAFLYIATEIWYGNVIPSCYLVNSSDIKDFIMDKGWLKGVSKIYKTRKANDEVRKSPNHEENKQNPNIRVKSESDSKTSHIARNRIRPGQPTSKDDGTEGANTQIQTKKQKQSERRTVRAKKQLCEDVILHDLDGIQASQHIPGDASKCRKISIDN